MIISASPRADIPARHGAWFMRRLEAGYCKTFKYPGLQFRRISLLPEDVDAFVFWTRDIGPFGSDLASIREKGFAFVVQYTINAHGDALKNPIAVDRAIEQAHGLAKRYGVRTVVWRYEPIVLNDRTSRALHLGLFPRLASSLKGATDEVVVSITSLGQESAERGMAAREERLLVSDLAVIAKRNGMRLTLCSQPEFLNQGASPARCIDIARLSDVAGRSIRVADASNRSGCLCAGADDIVPDVPVDMVPAPSARGEFLFPPPATFLDADGADLPF